MDMQSQMTRPYGHDQAEDPIRIHHQEEEQHQEKGASKVLKKVKEKAKKIKNSLTKHGHEHDHDVDEEEDEYDEQDPEVHGAPVYESSAVTGGVTGQPESLSYPGENSVPAPEEIIPPGTKVFPVVTSDYTRPVEPEPLRDASYEHEALSDPVKTTDSSDREEKREAPTHLLRVSELSDKEESREAHYEPMNNPASLLSTTEDVTRTFSPGEDEDLGGQRKVNIQRPKGLEEDPAAPGGRSDYLSGVSNYQSKVTDPTQEGGGEVGVPEIAKSLGRMKVTDESHDQKLGLGFERNLPKSNQEFERDSDSGISKDSPAIFGGESGGDLGNYFSGNTTRGHEFDQKNESGIDKSSSTGFGGESGAELGENFPSKSHERDQNTEFGIGKDSPTGFSGVLETRLREGFPERNPKFDQEIDSGIDKNLQTGFSGVLETRLKEVFPDRNPKFDQEIDFGIDKSSPTGLSSGSIAGLGEDFPARSHQFDQKAESGIGKDSPRGFSGESETKLKDDFPPMSHELRLKADSATGKDSPIGSHGYGEESVGQEKTIPVRNDDVKVETVLGRDLPTGTHDQFSPELSRPKERDDFDSKAEDAHEPKPSTYTEKIASATSVITDKAIAAKNTVASKLGYSGESEQHQNPVINETPRSATGYGQKVAGTVTEKLTPVYEKVKETGSNVMAKLPLTGGKSGAEETQPGEDKGVSPRDYVAEKLKPGEEDKALSEVIAEKLHLGGEKKTTTTKEVEVTVEKIPTDQVPKVREDSEVVAEEGKGGGMVGKIKGWFGGTTEETKPKTSDSVEESSQSLGSTVGFSDSGGGEAVVQVQRGLQESGN